MLLRLATVEGLRGSTDSELAHLKNIDSIQKNYGFLPLGLVATALKEQGAVYVDAALEAYGELMALQKERYPDDVAKMAVGQAEAFKLLGNVYIAKKYYSRALQHYTESLDLFAKYLGPTSGLAVDLEHRICEIRASYMDEV
eukprot:gene22934-30114_t